MAPYAQNGARRFDGLLTNPGRGGKGSPLSDLADNESEIEEALAAWEFHRTRPRREQMELSAAALAERAGFDLDPWQDAFLNSTAKRQLLNCGRQTGKSISAAVKALHGALYEPRTLTLLLSPGLRQSTELFKKMKDTYVALGKPVPSWSETSLQLQLENGSRIVALPGTSGRIRGYSGARRIIIDEAAWVPDEMYRAVRPMLAVSGGDLIAMSTPWGRRGWWYDAWESSIAGSQEWERYEVPATMCPRIPADFLEEEKVALGSDFDSEYMCQFVSSSATVFDRDWWSMGHLRYDPEAIPQRRSEAIIARFLSFDTAMKDKDSNDYTSCTVADLTGDYRLRTREVWRDRLRFPDLIAAIESKFVEWSLGRIPVRNVLIEDRASGTSAYQTLVAGTSNPELARKVVPFPTGNMSKRARGSLAAVWCKNGCVELPYPGETTGQWLEKFERELFGFTGTDQDEHDDQVDSFVQLILWLEESQHVMSTGYYARNRANQIEALKSARGSLNQRSLAAGRRR